MSHEPPTRERATADLLWTGTQKSTQGGWFTRPKKNDEEGKLNMEKESLQNIVAACRPFMQKCIQQEYDYQFDEHDLSFLPSVTYLFEHLHLYSEEEVSHLIVAEHLAEEIIWLKAFYDMRHDLMEAAKKKPHMPWYPYHSRLQAFENTITYFSATGIIRWRDDRELFALSTLVYEYPFYLSLAEKLVAHVHEEVGGDKAPELTREDLILLYELRLGLIRDGILSVCPTDYRKPSTSLTTDWLLAQKRDIYFEMLDQDKLGKWILFASHDEIDRLWRKIALATTKGQLGVAAKSSTANPQKTKHQHAYVIHVYTENYQDTETILSVREHLKLLGVVQPLAYRRHRSSEKPSDLYMI